MILTTTLQGFDAAAADFDAMARRAADLSVPLKQLGVHHQRKAARILDAGERGIQTRHRPGLATSMTYRVDPPNGLVVGSPETHAQSQQFGPPGGFYESSRPGGLLAIPIADNLRGKRQEPQFDSPREVEGGFFITSKKGNVLFVRRKDGSRRTKSRGLQPARSRGRRERRERPTLELLFVLKDRVPGTAHHYVTHDPADQAVWNRLASDWILLGR